MTCILSVVGKNFDVNDFMSKSPLAPDSFWRKGEKRFPRSKSSEEINLSSGVRVVASEADFSEFAQQIEDVTAFLRQNKEAISALSTFPGVEGVILDFGAEIHPPGWASFTFPAELLLLSGAAGVSLCLSVYPSENGPTNDVQQTPAAVAQSPARDPSAPPSA